MNEGHHLRDALRQGIETMAKPFDIFKPLTDIHFFKARIMYICVVRF